MDDRTQDAIKREMMRKSRDTIRIFNPLKETFRFKWDGFTHSVPAEGTKDVERYLADHYFKHISQKIIGDLQALKGEEILKRRKSHGDPDYLDPYVENREVWDKVPSLQDEQLLRQIRDQVILGLVEEFGMEFTPEETQEALKIDTRDVYERIMDEDKRIAPEQEVAQKNLAEEVTVNE